MILEGFNYNLLQTKLERALEHLTVGEDKHVR